MNEVQCVCVWIMIFQNIVITPAQFTGCSFGGAAIWQYESLKSRVQSYFDDVKADWMEKIRPQKQGDLRKQVCVRLMDMCDPGPQNQS